MIWESSTQTL